MDIEKLSNVPTNTYSVLFLSLEFVKSPKRKIDFAANIKPIGSYLPNMVKVRIKIRSIIPIHLPAFFKLSLLLPLTSKSHFFVSSTTKIEVGIETKIYEMI